MGTLHRSPHEASTPKAHDRARLLATWAGSRDGLWDWDLARREIRFSPRWKRLLGYTDEEFADLPEEWFRRVHPRDLDGLKRAIDAHLSGTSELIEHEFRMLHKDGSWRHFLVCGKKLDRAEYCGGSFTDITSEKSAEGRLLHEMFHDPMTGLANEALFLDRLELALSRRQRRKGPPVAVLYFDLDRFHHINDSLGLQAGDRLLGEVAQRLRARLRPGDTLARLGGDKFAILLDGVNTREAVRYAEATHASLSTPQELEGHELCIQASIGIALSTHASGRPADLLRDAITAMHRAKESGTTPYEVFDPEMNALAKERLHIEGDLRRALKAEEFVLHYQPMISLEAGSISAFEALVRWQHPTRGLVRPDIFIPIAEETGLIVPMGRWVIHEACRQLAGFHRAFPHLTELRMAVNLSAHQFQDPELIETVAHALHETGLPPRLLELEVTESVLMERSEQNTATLEALRKLGCRLSIDDFGTGYSSLACLHSFPLDQLKIDRSFVMGMEDEPEKVAIVRTILALARTLGLEVVAEGIETAAALSMLREFGCQTGQGYYFSSPIDGDAAQAFLGKAPTW